MFVGWLNQELTRSLCPCQKTALSISLRLKAIYTSILLWVLMDLFIGHLCALRKKINQNKCEEMALGMELHCILWRKRGDAERTVVKCIPHRLGMPHCVIYSCCILSSLLVNLFTSMCIWLRSWEGVLLMPYTVASGPYLWKAKDPTVSVASPLILRNTAKQHLPSAL